MNHLLIYNKTTRHAEDVHKIVVVQLAHVRAPVLEADELALLLEEFVVLGDVFGQDHEGQIDRPLHVAVVRPGHRAIHRLVPMW